MIFIISMMSTFSHATDGWQGPMIVTDIVAHKYSYIIETNSTLNDCGVPGRFVIESDAPMAEIIYKTALVALLTGRQVNIFVEGAEGCLVSGMVSSRIVLH